MVLAKEKNDEKAMEYFIRSVHKYTMNWGCWLEMTSLISGVEDVSFDDPTKAYVLIKSAQPNYTPLSADHCVIHVPSEHLT
jgi:hypothetical protein